MICFIPGNGDVSDVSVHCMAWDGSAHCMVWDGSVQCMAGDMSVHSMAGDGSVHRGDRSRTLTNLVLMA